MQAAAIRGVMGMWDLLLLPFHILSRLIAFVIGLVLFPFQLVLGLLGAIFGIVVAAVVTLGLFLLVGLIPAAVFVIIIAAAFWALIAGKRPSGTR